MLIPLTIQEIQKGLLKRDFSSVDLVNAYISRINSLDNNLNSFITISEDLAYKQAKRIDSLIQSADKSILISHPLFGCVVAHKDLFMTKGVRTTAASNVLKAYIPVYSATVVKKLENAGCICIGKTNCDAWGHGASGENSDFGPSKNPWNNSHVPGGSSSGSGVAVASNFCTFATGTDTGGSIRAPSNFCGAVGLKPTYGSVSRYGVISMASSLDSIGHITHSVSDSESVFKVTRGHDGRDSTLVNNKTMALNSKIKLGIAKEYFTKGLDDRVKENVQNAINIFKDYDIEIVDISLPHTKYAVSAYYIIQPAEVSSNLSRYDGIRYGNKRTDFSDEAKRRIMLGSYVLSAGYYNAYYIKAMKVRTKIICDFENAFKKVDAIISPVMPTPAFPLGEKTSNPLQMYLEDVYTAPVNLAGLPSLAIPNGFTINMLPLGFQLIGSKYSEPKLFHLGKLFEKATNWQPKVVTP